MSTAHPAGTIGNSTERVPERIGGQGAIVEPRGSVDGVGANAGNEEIFLSPRVMDGGAFARYSEMLKEIINRASEQGRTLEDFSADAEAMIKRCHDSGETINKRLQAGIRMLKMIDERAERTDQLLDKVQRALPDAQAMSEQIDRVIDERLAASESRINSVIEQAEQRAQDAERRAYEAIERSQEHAGELEALGRTVDDRLTTLREAIERGDRAHDELIASVSAEIEQARAQICTVVEGSLGRVHDANERLGRHADEALGGVESRIERVSSQIEPLVEASSRAMRALGMDPENPQFEDSPLARIEQLVDRGETQLASLDRVYRQLEDLQAQAEGVRSTFGNWLIEAAGKLDGLEARKDRVAGPMQQAAETIRSLGPDVEEKLELASTQLAQLQIEQRTLRETIKASSTVANQVSERMTNQSGQLQALLDGSLHKLSTRVEQAGVWLGTLINRAETLGGSLPGAGSMEFGSVGIPADSAPRAAVSHETRVDAPQAPVEIADADAAVDESSDTEPVDGSAVLPCPPQLPIDALSFDGMSGVIEHRDGSQG